MTASIETAGRTRDGQEVHLVTLEGGLRVQVLTYGGIITLLDAPGRAGIGNVVLGLPDLATYEAHNPNFGATIGRYAGRIACGRFSLDGVEYTLPRNEGDNTLHGGGHGFAKRVWRVEQADRASVRLGYTSTDDEEGFPGTLETSATFTVEDTTLRLDYMAQTDRATVLNLTNHSYFNLAGEGAGEALGHTLQVEADSIVEVDAHSIPTGRMLPVEGTPFDFRMPRALGAGIRTPHPQIVHGLGYDCCFVLRNPPQHVAALRQVAVLREAAQGRVMSVWTDQPGLQLYTANKLTGSLVGPSGRTYRAGDALCLETQHFPDSPNRPGFPPTVLRPGEVFRSTTEYRFATD